ncbi:MAG: AAA family ATPase [Candidatus Oxydemutatoraceae bacterium WSBS_2016_MAG_OTU14]
MNNSPKMDHSPKTQCFETLKGLAYKIRKDLEKKDFVLLFAYNRTGKTRLSMEFKNIAKNKGKNDTLYFNAFTEDLFTWENDLENDSNRCLKMNSDSRFFSGLKKDYLQEKVLEHLQNYADFKFELSNEKPEVIFSNGNNDNIKISRGEENIFIWCMFLVAVELVLDNDGDYKDIEYIYIDDPISSLDDGNAIAIACDIIRILKKEEDKKTNNKKEVKTIISSHHGLFFNVIWNELRSLNAKRKTYFYHRSSDFSTYKLRHIGDKPFSYHLAMLRELQNAIEADKLYAYHFNVMRGILETTATFFGLEHFSDCIPKSDKKFHARALNILSHKNYPIYGPKDMVDDNKKLFKKIFYGFLNKKDHEFNLDSFFKK